MLRGTLAKALAFVLLLISAAAPAVTILSGPFFVPSTNAPLAGVVRVTTDVECKLSVTVDDGKQTWSHQFYTYSTNHAAPLFGFRAGSTNKIYVSLQDRAQGFASVDEPPIFVAPRLPSDFPRLALRKVTPAKVEPGFLLFRVANGAKMAYYAIVNNSGEVVWYMPALTGLDVRQLENGNLFAFSSGAFHELNLLGQTVRSWQVRTNLLIDGHEGQLTDRGNILYISTGQTSVSNYPSSTILSNAPPRATANVAYSRVIEMSATDSTVLNAWSMLEMLDPRRITYLTTMGNVSDAEHANAVIEDVPNDAILVSLRHQNAVVKFSRSTGRLIWILGPHENWGPEWQSYLLTPVGLPFLWQYGQHAMVFTSRGTLLLFDNGNYRASPFVPGIADPNNHSRAVEYQIDEEKMQVSQVWDYGRTTAELLFTDRVGSAEPLPETGNILVTFGSVRYVNGQPPSSHGPAACLARIQEVTYSSPPEVVFDLAVTEYDNTSITEKDCYVYRTRRIPGLYGHGPQPVADLTLVTGPVPHLEFSADPARSYLVESSTDLTLWEPLGFAQFDAQLGIFRFQGWPSGTGESRYFRVVTQ